MANGTGFQVPYSFDPTVPVSSDKRYGKQIVENGISKTVPFENKAEALSLIELSLRFDGLLVSISNGLHWFKGGVLEQHLVPFSSGIVREDPIIVPDSAPSPFELIWDSVMVEKYGKHGHFEVWQNNELNNSPVISRTLTSGAPSAYQFYLDGIESEIHII